MSQIKFNMQKKKKNRQEYFKNLPQPLPEINSTNSWAYTSQS